MSEWELESRLVSIETKLDKILTLMDSNQAINAPVSLNAPSTPKTRPSTPKPYGEMKYGKSLPQSNPPPLSLGPTTQSRFKPQTNGPFLPLALNSPTNPPSPPNLRRSPMKQVQLSMTPKELFSNKGGTRNNKHKNKASTRKRK